MSKILCSNCNEEILGTDNFCPHCGQAHITKDEKDASHSNTTNAEAANNIVKTKKKNNPLLIFAIMISVVAVFYYIGSKIEFTATVDENETSNNTVKISGIASGNSAKVSIDGKPIKILNNRYTFDAPVKMGLNEFKVEYESKDKKGNYLIKVNRISEKSFYQKNPDNFPFRKYRMNIMDTGLKLYSSKDGFNMVYVGYIQCWYKNSDPVTFNIKLANGSSVAISRHDISRKYKWYYNKNDPAFNDENNRNFRYRYCN